MEAKLVAALPVGAQWQHEPEWDGFRCLAFRDQEQIHLQSKAGQPLARYFPEVVERLRALRARRFVLDGELVVPEGNGLSFDELLQRIRPATRLRVRRWSWRECSTTESSSTIDLLTASHPMPRAIQDMKQSHVTITRRLFDVGVMIKGVDGMIETVAGLLLLFRATALESWIWVWIAHRPGERHGDLLATLLARLATALESDARNFAIYYLIGHGVVKVFLAVSLLRERMWAFPISIAFFGLFVAYQLHRYALHHSPVLLGLALLDIAVIVLIAREWQLRGRGLPPPAARTT
ncbi:MAG TPA: DUF2127 domain-containing protein [Casimicrobiaceae bacterium]|nr:DUF2127 domain-containing protein [Casimicrobiaceae bacterium]